MRALPRRLFEQYPLLKSHSPYTAGRAAASEQLGRLPGAVWCRGTRLARHSVLPGDVGGSVGSQLLFRFFTRFAGGVSRNRFTEDN